MRFIAEIYGNEIHYISKLNGDFEHQKLKKYQVVWARNKSKKGVVGTMHPITNPYIILTEKESMDFMRENIELFL